MDRKRFPTAGLSLFLRVENMMHEKLEWNRCEREPNSAALVAEGVKICDVEISESSVEGNAINETTSASR
jgi:hypothetical protein